MILTGAVSVWPPPDQGDVIVYFDDEQHALNGHGWWARMGPTTIWGTLFSTEAAAIEYATARGATPCRR